MIRTTQTILCCMPLPQRRPSNILHHRNNHDHNLNYYNRKNGDITLPLFARVYTAAMAGYQPLG